jgi:RNA polymerase sigma-70 factor (ECF subfamily)
MVKSGRQQPGVPTDEELVGSLLQGDESALVELYNRYADSLFRAAILRLGDRQLAEEVLQDTYLALWNRAELFDPKAGSLIGWLSAMARNRSIDKFRAAGRRTPTVPFSGLVNGSGPEGQTIDDVLRSAQPLSAGSVSADPQQEVDGAWLREEVQRALDDIPEQERQVIRLAYYEELTQREIADRLDWPLGTVKTRTRRALSRLRVSLAGALGPELAAGVTAGEEPDGSR